jgi:hypothetical protein
MKKLIGLLFFILIFGFARPIWGQSYALDAGRFSQPSLQGSARLQGIGGTSIAIGGDISNVTANPAGLGFFTKSEFSFSPGVSIANSSSAYDTRNELKNPSTKDGKTAGVLNNLGLVFYSGKDAIEGGKWRGGSFGISLMRTNSFQNTVSFEGMNDITSKTDWYVDQTDGLTIAELEDDNPQTTDYSLEYQRAGYYANLVNPLNDGSNRYYTFFRDENEQLLGHITQTATLATKGSTNQISFAYGGNYDDKLYVGLSAGISTLNFSRNLDYRESIDSPESFLDSFNENDDLKTRGTGLNLSLGLVYRPLDIIRIGASFTSPTWYGLKEDFQTTFIAKVYDNNDVLQTANEPTLPGAYNYRLTTPWRASGGVAVFVGKYGFVSAEVEYIPYSSMRLRDEFNSSAMRESNQYIQTNFKNVLNYKLGAEARLAIFRVRGGVAYQGDALAGVDAIDRSTLSISGGLGVRLADWYLDLAVVNTRFNSVYVPYNFDSKPFLNQGNTPSDYRGYSPIATTKNQFWNGVVSIGFYF